MPIAAEKTIRTVIEILHDSQRAFADIGERLTDHSAKTFFLEESLTRAGFAGELDTELTHQGVHDVKEGGTTSGTVHRVWANVKASLGGGDHTLLETAEQGEDVAKKAYAEALDDKSVTGNLRDLLERQQQHILQAHDKVKALRDSKAA